MEIDKHKNQFGNLAQDYTKYRKEYPDELYDFLFSLTQKENNKILDIACGTGKSTERLVRNENEVFGCDIDPLMIEEAKKQAENKNIKIDYKVTEVESLPYEDSEFDIVTVGTAFHWFVNEKAISEIKRVLKDGGLLFIYWTLTTKDIPDEDSIPQTFFQKYDWKKVPSELRNLGYISDFLSNNGFANAAIHRIPVVTDYSVEEYVGLQKTASAYGVLPSEDKKKFTEELTEILTEKLGTRDHFSLEDEIQICYGFKK